MAGAPRAVFRDDLVRIHLGTNRDPNHRIKQKPRIAPGLFCWLLDCYAGSVVEINCNAWDAVSPAISFFNFVPLCLRSIKVDACKSEAIIESTIVNARHAIGDRDACKACTIIESTAAEGKRSCLDLIRAGDGILGFNQIFTNI